VFKSVFVVTPKKVDRASPSKIYEKRLAKSDMLPSRRYAA
jgi:hypothetical protein